MSAPGAPEDTNIVHIENANDQELPAGAPDGTSIAPIRPSIQQLQSHILVPDSRYINRTPSIPTIVQPHEVAQSDISEQALDYAINKRNREMHEKLSNEQAIHNLFTNLNNLQSDLYHNPFITKKNIYSGVLFVGFIIAIIVLIAVIIICVVGHKNNYKYNTNKYGMQRTYTQYVIWQPIGSSNNNANKFFTASESKWQIVTFPEPNARECIIAYSATCQGNTLQETNTGATNTTAGSNLSFSLPYVSNCSSISPNSCVVTVSSASPNASSNCPYGLYVTATYSPLMPINGNGTQYANNLTLNDTYKTYQYQLIKSSTESSIAFFAPSNYIPPKS